MIVYITLLIMGLMALQLVRLGQHMIALKRLSKVLTDTNDQMWKYLKTVLKPTQESLRAATPRMKLVDKWCKRRHKLLFNQILHYNPLVELLHPWWIFTRARLATKEQEEYLSTPIYQIVDMTTGEQMKI